MNLQKRNIILLILGWFVVVNSSAQQTKYVFQCSTDSSCLEGILHQLPQKSVLDIAKLFINTPYQAGMLNEQGDERLVITASHTDCQIFVETVLALFELQQSGASITIDNFAYQLQHIRYRNGMSDDYVSRLHYFEDWIFENSEQGNVQDITQRLGGIAYQKTINFMTQHPQYYKPLSDSSNLEAMKEVESNISKQSHYYIPQEQINKCAHLIHDGDILALTTTVDGLDIAHVGFAIKQNGVLYFLHASSDKHRVMITETSLYDYLKSHKSKDGIMILRTSS